VTPAFTSIQDIVANHGRRCDSAPAFFSNFQNAWDATRCQVLKLETRQSYQEPGNHSLEAYLKGDQAESERLLVDGLEVDNPLYTSLREHQVDFIRCRPLVFPLSAYMQWEMKTYVYTAAQGVRIGCCNREQLSDFFDSIATHDFMVFDARFGFVHDYDKSGLIRGGWVTDDVSAIVELQKIFIFIKSHCRPFELFVR
jgi:hypothetical protein